MQVGFAEYCHASFDRVLTYCAISIYITLKLTETSRFERWVNSRLTDWKKQTPLLINKELEEGDMDFGPENDLLRLASLFERRYGENEVRQPASDELWFLFWVCKKIMHKRISVTWKRLQSKLIGCNIFKKHSRIIYNDAFTGFWWI